MPLHDRMLHQKGPHVGEHEGESMWAWHTIENFFMSDDASTLIAASAVALTTLALAF